MVRRRRDQESPEGAKGHPMTEEKRSEIRKRIARAYSVPPGKRKLIVVTVAVAVRSRRELDSVTDGFDRVLARRYPEEYRLGKAPWRIVTVPADRRERREWRALLKK
jgi:hypothetical protein